MKFERAKNDIFIRHMKYKYKNFGNVARWAYSSNELYQKKNCMTNRQYVTDAFLI